MDGHSYSWGSASNVFRLVICHPSSNTRFIIVMAWFLCKARRVLTLYARSVLCAHTFVCWQEPLRQHGLQFVLIMVKMNYTSDKAPAAGVH